MMLKKMINIRKIYVLRNKKGLVRWDQVLKWNAPGNNTFQVV